MYATGPFTRVMFTLVAGRLLIMLPRRHAEGEKGDLVNTVVTIDNRYVNAHEVYKFL